MSARPSFWAASPCECCARRVPRNRTWRANVCTPSCAVQVTSRSAEGKPCLACQDRIAERRSGGERARDARRRTLNDRAKSRETVQTGLSAEQPDVTRSRAVGDVWPRETPAATAGSVQRLAERRGPLGRVSPVSGIVGEAA
jgi:hypothetical protein